MKKTIFHGSCSVIRKPVYGAGKKYNDYGVGFYCTESKDLAMEWSVTSDKNGYCNEYELDLDDLRILDLNNDQYTILHWLTILLENRSFDISYALAYEAKEYLLKYFAIDYREYDVIIGYRADDSYFSFAQDFINGAISYRQLSQAMHLGKLGQQIVLISKKSFEKLKFVDCYDAKSSKWFSKKEARDNKARRDYFSQLRNRRIKGDIYITQILDEEMKSDDIRLR